MLFAVVSRKENTSWLLHAVKVHNPTPTTLIPCLSPSPIFSVAEKTRASFLVRFFRYTLEYYSLKRVQKPFLLPYKSKRFPNGNTQKGFIHISSRFLSFPSIGLQTHESPKNMKSSMAMSPRLQPIQASMAICRDCSNNGYGSIHSDAETGGP